MGWDSEKITRNYSLRELGPNPVTFYNKRNIGFWRINYKKKDKFNLWLVQLIQGDSFIKRRFSFVLHIKY